MMFHQIVLRSESSDEGSIWTTIECTYDLGLRNRPCAMVDCQLCLEDATVGCLEGNHTPDLDGTVPEPDENMPLPRLIPECGFVTHWENGAGTFEFLRLTLPVEGFYDDHGLVVRIPEPPPGTWWTW